MTLPRPLIAVDLVGALEDGWSAKRQWLLAHGYRFGPEPMMRQQIASVIGPDEYRKLKGEVYSPLGIARHGVIDGAVECIAALSRVCDIAVVSARSPHLLAPTLEWLGRTGLAPLVSTVALLGNQSGSQSETKIAWCERYSARVLIDDDLRHLSAPSRIPIERILLDLRGRRSTLPEGVRRAASWSEAVAMIIKVLPG